MHKLMLSPISGWGRFFSPYILIQALTPPGIRHRFGRFLWLQGIPCPRLAAYGTRTPFVVEVPGAQYDLLVRLDDGLRALDRFNTAAAQYGLSLLTLAVNGAVLALVGLAQPRWKPRDPGVL